MGTGLHWTAEGGAPEASGRDRPPGEAAARTPRLGSVESWVRRSTFFSPGVPHHEEGTLGSMQPHLGCYLVSRMAQQHCCPPRASASRTRCTSRFLRTSTLSPSFQPHQPWQHEAYPCHRTFAPALPGIPPPQILAHELCPIHQIQSKMPPPLT